jgi:hypothetical protein
MSTDLLGMIAAIALGIVVFGLLGIGLVFVIRDTIRQRGNWGINFKPGPCQQCGTPMPMIRKPDNWRQAMWGGWTCPECGLELDKWGRPVEGQAPGKWAVLRAIEEIDEGEHRPKHRDERIHEGNDQMQPSRSIAVKACDDSWNEPPLTDQYQPDESRLPRSFAWYVGWGAVAGVFLFGLCLAIGGLTGLLHTEYKTTPGQQAIILVVGWSWYGVVPGVLVGLLVGWLCRRRGMRGRRSIHG